MTSRTTDQSIAFSAEYAGSLVRFTPTDCVDESLRFAVMIARYKESFLLVYNCFRACWEIPGGLVEPGETAQEAAVREFFEETGQSAAKVWSIGRLEVSRELETVGALYGCEIAELQPFVPNDEIAELALWHGQRLVGVEHPGQLSSLDQRLTTLYDARAKPK